MKGLTGNSSRVISLLMVTRSTSKQEVFMGNHEIKKKVDPVHFATMVTLLVISLTVIGATVWGVWSLWQWLVVS